MQKQQQKCANSSPFFSSSSHMLLNSVSKLSLFGAFDDPGCFRVDVEAVMESLEKNKCSSIRRPRNFEVIWDATRFSLRNKHV